MCRFTYNCKEYHTFYSDQLVVVCGMPSHFPTDWFVPDGRVRGTPDDRVGICVPAFSCIKLVFPIHFRYDSDIHVVLHQKVKAMTHQPTQLLSWVESGPVGICVIGLQLDFFLHSSLIPDCLVGSGPTYDSTVELGWVMCHVDIICMLYYYPGI